MPNPWLRLNAVQYLGPVTPPEILEADFLRAPAWARLRVGEIIHIWRRPPVLLDRSFGRGFRTESSIIADHCPISTSLLPTTLLTVCSRIMPGGQGSSTAKIDCRAARTRTDHCACRHHNLGRGWLFVVPCCR